MDEGHFNPLDDGDLSWGRIWLTLGMWLLCGAGLAYIAFQVGAWAILALVGLL